MSSATRTHRARGIGLRHAEPWLFVAPALAVIGFVYLYPIISMIQYSVRFVSPSPYFPSHFAGLDNFRFIFGDSVFRTAIANNVKLFATVPVLLVLSALLGAVLFDRPRGATAYRTLVFLPYVVAIPVVGICFSYVFMVDGLLNTALHKLGLGFAAINWLGSPKWALMTIGLVIIWKELGFGVVLCQAALSSVDPDLFSAARVDGAGWWRVWWHVSLPRMAPTLAFYGIVEAITMLSWVFAYVYVMTGGGPENSTTVSEYYIYQMVFQNNVVGIGAAACLVLLALVSLLIVARIVLGRRMDTVGQL